MQEELVNLQNYDLNLIPNTGGIDGFEQISQMFNDFVDEYKYIIHLRSEHQTLVQELKERLGNKDSRQKTKDYLEEVSQIPFKQRDTLLVNLCNSRFDLLVKCGVFSPK
jgi:hypothetical protein